jgi:amino acid transporter
MRTPVYSCRPLCSKPFQAITIGGIIGIGFATTSGQVLAIAGPGGTLIAFSVNGFVAICVMEGICEMIVLWPISNAMIEFVRAFVDEDLAIVVGIAYWYQSLWIFKFALQDTTF